MYTFDCKTRNWQRDTFMISVIVMSFELKIEFMPAFKRTFIHLIALIMIYLRLYNT